LVARQPHPPVTRTPENNSPASYCSSAVSTHGSRVAVMIPHLFLLASAPILSPASAQNQAQKPLQETSTEVLHELTVSSQPSLPPRRYQEPALTPTPAGPAPALHLPIRRRPLTPQAPAPCPPASRLLCALQTCLQRPPYPCERHGARTRRVQYALSPPTRC